MNWYRSRLPAAIFTARRQGKSFLLKIFFFAKGYLKQSAAIFTSASVPNGVSLLVAVAANLVAFGVLDELLVIGVNHFAPTPLAMILIAVIKAGSANALLQTFLVVFLAADFALGVAFISVFLEARREN